MKRKDINNSWFIKLKNSIASGLAILLILFAFGLTGPMTVRAAFSVNVPQTTWANFAVLAGTPEIRNTGPSIITGNVGLSPATGAGIIGFPPATVIGTTYAVDAFGPAGSINNPGLLTIAKQDLSDLYDFIAGQIPFTTIPSELGSTTQIPGIYRAAAGFQITGTLTLDGQGDPNGVFIFQMPSTLTTAAASHVNLINGANPCNVYWQLGSSTGAIGTNSTFIGNILALTSITLTTGANIQGRVLAQNGAVTLDSNIISIPTCGGVFGGSGPSGPVLIPPLIDVLKIPNPLSLPNGPGPVTYTYRVRNIGTVPMTTVTMLGDTCSPIILQSGDTNGNGALDVNETWDYTCTTTLTATHTNTVIATGFATGLSATDSASSTVVVSTPIIPPLIHVVKIPNIFVTPVGGGTVTYNYTVTNPGTAALSDVSITDDRCTELPGRVLGHPGDLNQNNLLESNEAWQFTCVSNITATTTNTATASGTANGLTATDFAVASVAVPGFALVTPPVTPPSIFGLPTSGLPPKGKSPPWNTAVPIGILAVFWFYKRRKKLRLVKINENN